MKEYAAILGGQEQLLHPMKSANGFTALFLMMPILELI